MVLVKVLTAGSARGNVGTITLRHKTTVTNVFCVMPIGYNETLVGAFTVPAARTGYIVQHSFRGSRGNLTAYADTSLRSRPVGGVYNTLAIGQPGTGVDDDKTLVGALVAPAGADIKLRVDAVSAGTLNISGDFTIVLVRN